MGHIVIVHEVFKCHSVDRLSDETVWLTEYGRFVLPGGFPPGGGRKGLKYGISRKIREIWQPWAGCQVQRLWLKFTKGWFQRTDMVCIYSLMECNTSRCRFFDIFVVTSERRAKYLDNYSTLLIRVVYCRHVIKLGCEIVPRPQSQPASPAPAAVIHTFQVELAM